MGILQALPIDVLLPGILEELRKARNVVIEAAPGAGKTTRVPPALLALGGEVLVLEPRRIAARMAARRVAQEMGERVGETAGYQVRFEEAVSSRTRLRFMTEGVLTRRLLTDPELRGVGTVVLDEFHERHLDTDLALALLRRLQQTRRRDLRLAVMSATLDAAPVARFLGDCASVRSEGRLFPLEVTHLPYSAAPLEEQVAQAAGRALREQKAGDILVFLPGAAEIRRAARACGALPVAIFPLHGDLSPAEQDRAVGPGAERKLILSTNVAESSITIEGVTCVIDSGLVRVASDSPWTGLPTLEVARIGKASAQQRAGRAGRTGPGKVFRLYTAEDYHRRAEHDRPEIVRRELSQVCLQLETMGIRDTRELEWLEPPPEAAVQAAEALLDRLHARGREAASMARLPLHPRLARMVLEADKRKVGNAGCAVAALLSSGERVGSVDLLDALEEDWTPRMRATYDQIRRIARVGQRDEADNEALAISVLAAFPDRVAKARAGGVALLASGGSAAMAEEMAGFLIALDIEDRSDRAAPLIRLACRIQPEWLIDLFPERVVEKNGAEWNRTAERVENVSALLYDGLTIQESRGGAPEPEEAARVLAEKAMEAGVGRFVDGEELAAFVARVEFASQHSNVPPIGEAQIREALQKLCWGLQTFAQLKAASAGFIGTLERGVDAKALSAVAPARIQLAGGRSTRVHYEQGKPPWIASRLQDFFGMREGPRIANGQAPVTIHLLAPNQRPVQTTTDLAGFWERLYPQVRKELGRRYPRHAWPEKAF
jgi:ATP-dependent helicase HrpB